MKTQGYLGIDVGTQGLSAIFVDTEFRIRGTGEGFYDMVSGLEAGAYEQRPADWERALVAAVAGLRRSLSAA
ncbi:MAG: xylulokinase, partial [Planctomycetes bacterium]|nr:xylulokinase [Planctomycetota bacterium]